MSDFLSKDYRGAKPRSELVPAPDAHPPATIAVQRAQARGRWRRLTCYSACLLSEQAAELISGRTVNHTRPPKLRQLVLDRTSYLPLRLDIYALISLI
jgi:hypothetical protein